MANNSSTIPRAIITGGQKLSAYKSFIYSIESEFTKKLYVKHLKNYIKYRFGLYEDERDYDKLLEGDPRLIQSQIIEYVIYLKEDRKLTAASIRSITSALHRFYEINDLELRWKKIYSYAGQIKKKGKDRPYTKEEISRFLDKADQRECVMVLLMCSMGMRIGGLPSRKLRNLENVDTYNIYKITVYENDNEEYTTLCTQECKKAIDSYLDYRRREGERLKEDAPLIREEFDITDELHIANPRHVSVDTLMGLIKRLGAISGVIEKMAQIHNVNDNDNKKIERRRPVMCTHGFRKFFETSALKTGMSPLYTRMLMGQKAGLESSYFKPTISDLLEGNDRVIGYTGIMDYLTINEENKLRQKVQELTIQKQDELKTLRRDMNAITSLFKDMLDNPKLGNRVIEVSRTIKELGDIKREKQGLGENDPVDIGKELSEFLDNAVEKGK